MPDRTQRGEKDRQREDEAVQGEPVNAHRPANTGQPAATVTRDKSVSPSDDSRRDGRGESGKS